MKCAYCDTKYKGDDSGHCVNCGAPEELKQESGLPIDLLLKIGVVGLYLSLKR
jgi:hypothetical protein